MRKNKKMPLLALRVKSFLIVPNDSEKQTIKAGLIISNGPPTSTSADSHEKPCTDTLYIKCGASDDHSVGSIKCVITGKNQQN